MKLVYSRSALLFLFAIIIVSLVASSFVTTSTYYVEEGYTGNVGGNVLSLDLENTMQTYDACGNQTNTIQNLNQIQSYLNNPTNYPNVTGNLRSDFQQIIIPNLRTEVTAIGPNKLKTEQDRSMIKRNQL